MYYLKKTDFLVTIDSALHYLDGYRSVVGLDAVVMFVRRFFSATRLLFHVAAFASCDKTY